MLRPSGDSKEARFWQWAYDSLIELSPRSGPGVLTSRTTKGVMQRMIAASGPSGSSRHPNICHLPKLVKGYTYFGYWFDAGSQIHYVNISGIFARTVAGDLSQYQTEGGNLLCARFANRFVSSPGVAIEAMWQFEQNNAANGNGISDCLLVVGSPSVFPFVGPYDYPISGSTNPRVGVGQYLDVPIIRPRSNCSVLYGQSASNPPTIGRTEVYQDGTLHYAYDRIGTDFPAVYTPESYATLHSEPLPF